MAPGAKIGVANIISIVFSRAKYPKGQSETISSEAKAAMLTN